jgi:hypothetical protein
MKVQVDTEVIWEESCQGMYLDNLDGKLAVFSWRRFDVSVADDKFAYPVIACLTVTVQCQLRGKPYAAQSVVQFDAVDERFEDALIDCVKRIKLEVRKSIFGA